MIHYQQQFQCSVCGRKLVVDITSIGVRHETIQAVTCLECATNLLGDKIEELKSEDIKLENEI